MTIYHAVIHTMTEAGTIPHGFLTVENGKITCVQSGDPDTVTEDDLDAKGSLLLPGFIDAHTHLGILEDGLDFEGDDCNECTDPFTPHLRAIDGVNPVRPLLFRGFGCWRDHGYDNAGQCKPLRRNDADSENCRKLRG